MSPQTASIATSLNNEGISQLEANNFEAATASFSRGLSMVKRTLASNNWENKSSGPLNASQVPVEDNFACQFHKLQGNVSTMDFEENDDQDVISAEVGFVFQEPIMVLPRSLESTSYADLVKLSFIQLYNLALSHHLCALKRSNPEPVLRKALALYELAYTIHISEDVELTVLQSMAIVNNLGHLHKQLNNIEKSQQCFENLLTTLMFVKDCGEQDSHKVLDGFLSNVMSLILCGSKPAPAA